MSTKAAKVDIYVGECVATGKRYVGSSVNGKTRIISHQKALILGKHKNRHLQSAWNKYGAEQFVWSIVENCSVRSRRNREQWWIEHYCSDDPKTGFNIVYPVRGVAPSPMMSEILKASWPDERRAKHSKIISSQWNDAKLRERRSVGLKMGQDPEVARALMLKRWQDPAERKKFEQGLVKAVAKTALNKEKHKRASDRLKKLHKDPKFVAQIKENFAKGRIAGTWTDERKQGAADRGRERLTEQWQDPGYREARVKNVSNQWKNPEVRRKMLAGMRAAIEVRRKKKLAMI